MGNVLKKQSKESTARSVLPVAKAPSDAKGNPTSTLQQESFAASEIECVCCADNKRCSLRAPCGHLYCKNCIRAMFQMALKDRSRLPVRCCNVDFDQSWHQLVLIGTEQATYAEALEEYQAKNKMYCPNRPCAAFINLEKVGGDMTLNIACPKCKLVICSACLASHPNYTCAQFKALPEAERTLDDLAFLDLAKAKRYARCSKCHHYVERIDGCNNIVCRCRHSFCYACNASTSKCVCGRNQHATTNRPNQYTVGPPPPARAAPAPKPAAVPAPVSVKPAAVPAAAAHVHHHGTKSSTGKGTQPKRAPQPCQTHQWHADETMELHVCDNCLQNKYIFQNRCVTCGMRVCSTCRFRRL